MAEPAKTGPTCCDSRTFKLDDWESKAKQLSVKSQRCDPFKRREHARGSA